MKADTICCYCISKRMRKEASKNHCMREVGVYSREISQLSKIRPPPSFRSHLSSSPMGVVSRNYGKYSALAIAWYSKCTDASAVG